MRFQITIIIPLFGTSLDNLLGICAMPENVWEISTWVVLVGIFIIKSANNLQVKSLSRQFDFIVWAVEINYSSDKWSSSLLMILQQSPAQNKIKSNGLPYIMFTILFARACFMNTHNRKEWCPKKRRSKVRCVGGEWNLRKSGKFRNRSTK